MLDDSKGVLNVKKTTTNSIKYSILATLSPISIIMVNGNNTATIYMLIIYYAAPNVIYLVAKFKIIMSIYIIPAIPVINCYKELNLIILKDSWENIHLVL